MLKTRIIPTLLYRDFGLVKGISFDTRRQIGGALQAIKVYNLRGVDELIFVDVTATQQGRSPDLALIDELADDCFMPLTVGGGVRTVDDIGDLLSVGADKVSIGTAAVEDPALVEQGARRFGTQCIVASIDFRVEDGVPSVWTHSATRRTDHDLVTLARRLEHAGAGELLLTSIDRDGTMSGFDLDMTRAVCDAVSIPVIASGGAGTYADMAAAIVDAGASAVAAASIFHFTQMNPLDAKRHFASVGIPVRR